MKGKSNEPIKKQVAIWIKSLVMLVKPEKLAYNSKPQNTEKENIVISREWYNLIHKFLTSNRWQGRTLSTDI